MPQKSNRSDYIILAALAVFAAAVFLAMIAWGWLREDRQSPAVRTTHSTDFEGTLASYLLLKRLGLPVRRFDRPLLAETASGVGVLVVLSPTVPFSPTEMERLRDWVVVGGVLVCDARTAAGVWDPAEAAPSLPPWVEGTDPADRRRVTSLPPDAAAQPLARDVRRVHFSTTETIEPGGSPDGDVGPLVLLLSDTRGARIAARQTGAGTVVALADSSFLANGWVGRADNAVLAVNLAVWALGRAGPRRIAFDEYHFGYGRHQSRWRAMAAMLFGSAPGWAVLAATAAGVLGLIYRGRRFGVRRAPGRVRRRSKLEYVHSVGATYRAAGANRLAMHLIHQWFRGRCAAMVGLPDSAGAEQIAQRLARRTGGDAGRYKRTWDDCEAAIESGRGLSGRRLSALLNSLAKMESEISDGHRARK